MLEKSDCERKRGGPMKQFSPHRMRELRLERKVKVKALAYAAGCTSKSVENYENGTRVPDANMLYAFAWAIGVPVEDLYE